MSSIICIALIVLAGFPLLLSFRWSFRAAAPIHMMSERPPHPKVQPNFQKLCSMCPSLKIISNTSEEYKIASEIEQDFSGDTALDMSTAKKKQMLGGLWKAIATTLPMSSLTSFSQVAMFKTGTDLDDHRVEVEDVYQFVDPKTREYDNYVLAKLHPKSDAGDKISVAVVTRGLVTFPVPQQSLDGHSNRLGVKFTGNEVVLTPRCGSLQSFLEDMRREGDSKQIRECLHVPESARLRFPMQVEGWSDCTALNQDGQFRIMRGNNRNTYILRKVM